MDDGVILELQTNSANWAEVTGQIVNMEKKIFPEHESLIGAFIEELRKKKFELLYIQVNREVAGYVIFYCPSSSSAFITELAVKEEYRKQGYGEALVKATIKTSRTRKVKRISLNVDPLRVPAMSLYKKLGFQVDTLLEGYYSPHQNAYRMHLDLDSN